MLPTSSRLERAFACEASNVLPQVERQSGEPQRQGRVIHAFLEAVVRLGRDKALAAVPPDHVDLCDAIDVAALPLTPGQVAAEVAFAWDPATDTARELGRGLDRDYSAAKDCEFCGTADVVALAGDDAVWVGDYKPRWSSGVTPAAKNWQLRSLALYAARAYGRSRATVDVIHVGPDGAWFDHAEFDAIDLDSFALELANLKDRIASLRGTPEAATQAEGAWCRYCPSFAYCPAKTRLAASLALAKVDGLVHLSREKAGEARARLKAARQVLDRIEETLDEYAREEPYTMPDGTRVAPVEKRVEKIDPPAAKPVLERLGLLDAGEWTVSKTALTKYAGKPKAEEALAELRKAGAMKLSISHPIQETSPRTG